MQKTRLNALVAIALVVTSAIACAATNSSRIFETGDTTCITSNGLPDHSTGTFPNRGNPHSIRTQSIEFCVPTDPDKGSTARDVQTIGIALNGVIIRPGTADYYDPSSPRGHSRDRSSGWNLEGMGAADTLGLDQNNAHVDQSGLYHYHGPSPALTSLSAGSLIGYAADGFEIHYVGDAAQSSYRLLPGTRATAPGGTHDGTYVEDWDFIRGSGNLDQCNGATVNGRYVYFATDTYPFFPRCLYGTEISRFASARGRAARPGPGNGPRPRKP